VLAAAWSRCCLGAGDELGTGYFGCLWVVEWGQARWVLTAGCAVGAPRGHACARREARTRMRLSWGCLEMTEAELSNLMQHDPIERPRSKTTSSV
jgi:hypothetical protein